jgi:hypothetical protein
MRYVSLCCAIIGFASAAPASARDALSLLTIQGEVQSIAQIPRPLLRRIAAAEGGRNVVVDDYAIVRQDVRGPQIAFATDAFRIGASHLATAGSQIEVAARSLHRENTRGATRSASPGEATSGQLGLLVRHQSDHPVEHNFTPMPQMDFLPQVILADEFEGRRGFAIVSIGETGRVMQVQILASSGRTRVPELQAAIASGMRTSFQDERRHDHTVYMVYEVAGHEVRQIGRSLVTLPMCCGGCQGICP